MMIKDTLANIGALFVAIVIVCVIVYIKAKIKEKYKKYKCARTRFCDFRRCKNNKYGHCFDDPAHCYFNYLREKRIPKKPPYDEYKGIYYCPNCEKLQAYSVDDFDDYCGICGQALDWSGDNDKT